ncbi:unnamed protein product [Rhizoctonia solani]|uniref:T6SS Phospholipase effector Tle1-like catalytic domain-containing protein n=1 Tax=Rhizoctonia solani TaxID=456999 RepID=A0A8H3A1Q1_9AGAM|nr:unnamed protein product [Rhizoctonia solani]
MAQRLPTVDARLPSAKPRTLVLCFDGTTNVYDNTNTNVVKLFSLLKRDKRDEQMVYYQPGIGTYAPPGIFFPVTMALAKIADQGVALYLDKHVMGGYQFLMKHYNEGDRICLFGFSRGAYTARALAGMLHKVGLLPPDNVEQISFAYQMYKRTDLAGYTESVGFKKTFSREVKIEFMGVWDTVSSVGLLWPRHLPFTSSNSIVKTFRHAVSLDEHRAKFKQNVWHVHSATPQRDPDQGSPNINIQKSKVPSPTLIQSPTAILPLPAKANKSKLKLKKDGVNITVTDATPPPQAATLDDAPIARNEPPLQLGQVQTDLRNFFPQVQSPGVHEENRGGPTDESWHSREPTQVKGARPDSGVDGLDIENTEATVKASEQAPKTLPTVKSDINLASGLQSGVGVAASIGVAGEKCESDNKESSGIMGWLRSKGKPKKQSTHLSGGGKFEAAIELQISDGGSLDEQETDVLEVWFAGCHSDVGGGEERNDAKYSLSNISLRWMVRQIILSQCGIQFNNDALREMKIPLPTLRFDKNNPLTLYSSPADATAIEEAQKQERRDALAPLHNALRNPLWWPLEFFPLVHSYQDEEGNWHRSFSWNLFGPRHARKTLKVVKVHQSVKYRMEQMEKETGKPYKPRALIDGFDDGHFEWVD